MCAYLQTHHPPVATYFPVSLLSTPPPTPALVPASPRLALPRSEPSTCGEDAESDERLANHVTPALGTELDAVREEFPGAGQVRPGSSSSTARWAAGGESSADRLARSVQAATVAALVSGGARRKGGGARSQLCALRRQAHFCSIPAARAQSPPATSPNPSHPALLRGRGHPLAFPLPAHWSQESRPRAASAGQWAQARAFSGFSSSSGSLAMTVLEAKAKQSANGSLPSGIQLSFPL